MAAKAIRHIGRGVNDLNSAQQFFEDNFGFKTLYREVFGEYKSTYKQAKNRSSDTKEEEYS
jgi:catechol 2,3-dioxygenase-like lactoylglutathione lyase family enzyme